MTDTISKFFNKQFTPTVQVTSVDEPLYYSDIDQDLTDDELDEDISVAPVKDELDDLDEVPKKPVEKPVEDELDDLDEDVKHDESISENIFNNRIERLKNLELKNNKKAKGLGLFSFRKDTKETLQSLLNRIVKLESVISYQNEQIKQLKTGIKSINQALPSSIRKDVFGNYFSNSLEDNSDSSEDRQSPNSLDGKQVYQSNYNIGGALNPDKVYPKITFSEFRKLYNKL